MENRLQVVQRFERECELVPPPQARDILFQAQRPGGTEDIYALRIRDSSIRRIVRADTFSSRSLPTWSPNGRSIAFTREFGDTAQLYILDSLSGTPRHIAMGLTGFIAFPDWSPDGTQLLFSAGTHDHYGVYLIQADGTGLRAVLQDTVTYRSPSWSPRGDEFAVSTYRNGRSEILIVNLGTGASRTVLSPDSAYADFPQWSPQGTNSDHRVSGNGSVCTRRVGASTARTWRFSISAHALQGDHRRLRIEQLRPLVTRRPVDSISEQPLRQGTAGLHRRFTAVGDFEVYSSERTAPDSSG